MAEEMESQVTEEAKGESQGPNIESLIAAQVDKIRAELEAKSKSEIVGLNKRISELDRLNKEAQDSKKTVEERLADIERDNADKERALGKERLVNQLRKEAAERGIDFESMWDIDNPPPSLEKGIELLDRQKKYIAELETKIRNEQMVSKGHKPGSGKAHDTDANIFPAGLSEEIRAAMSDPALDRFK